MELPMTKIEFLFRQLDATVAWYKQAEDRGKFLIGLNALLVGVLDALIFVGTERIQAVRTAYTTPIWVLLGLVAAGLVASYSFIFFAMWPRHRSHDRATRPSEKLWFFGDVAQMTKGEHREAMATWDDDAVVETLVSQNHILSSNVWAKHQALSWAMALTIATLVGVFALGVAYAIGVAGAA
jgi:hypothetical protein